ncbi:MAG: YihY/virulence factor BrkB family protein [Acidimicrobiales bacterium]
MFRAGNVIRSVVLFFWDVGKKWYYGGIGDLAAGVTFWILLTLPASILALSSALGWLGPLVGESAAQQVENNVVEYIDRIFTSEAEVVGNAVRELFNQQNPGLVTLSLAFAFWTISRGFAGLLRTVDEVYEVENGRPWYTARLMALVLGLGSLMISAPLVLIEIFIWEQVPDGLLENWLRFGTSVFILVLWASLIFHVGSSIRSKWRWDLPGALVSAVLWWLLTWGFRYYVNFARGENAALGAIGAWLLALTWIWFAAQGLLIGAAVNAVLGDRLGIDRGKRDWKINEKIFRTGEMRRVEVDDHDAA